MISWIRQLGPAFEANHGRYLFALFAMALVAGRWWLATPAAGRRFGPRQRRVAGAASLALLAAAALFSVAIWNNFFHFHYGRYLNGYEFFHHYLGSKYAKELGYFDLYNAALAADAETGRWYRPRDGRINDLTTYRFEPVESVLHGDRDVRVEFSPERWSEWRNDILFFKKTLGPAAWNRLLRDKGYNGTPAWTMLVGGLLTRHVSTDEKAGLMLLALLDVVLLLGALACVAWAFGAWPALLTAVFMASSYLMAHVHMKGALLRTDFVVCLVLAACLLKQGRHGLAGMLVGCSTMSRLFPAAYLFGPGAKLAWDAIESRGLPDRRHLRFFGGFAAILVVLFSGSVVYHGGMQVWSDYATKISLHRSEFHIWNVGFETVMNAELDAQAAATQSRLWPKGAADSLLDRPVLRPAAGERRRILTLAVQLLVLVAGFFAVRRLEDHRAFAFGFVPAFFLVAPTYYYYITLLLPFLFFAQRPDRGRDVVGVLYLFFFGVSGFWCYHRWEQYFPTYFWISVLTLPLVLYMLAVSLEHSWLPLRESAGTPANGRKPVPRRRDRPRGKHP